MEKTENEGEKASILKAMHDVKELVERNRVREKEAAGRMFKFPDAKDAKKKSELTQGNQGE